MAAAARVSAPADSTYRCEVAIDWCPNRSRRVYTFTSASASSVAKVCLLCGIPHKRNYMVVNTLIDWQRDGVDIAAGLQVLSNYLGHVNPASTYWYISAVPELMQLAAAGLDRRPGGLS